MTRFRPLLFEALLALAILAILAISAGVLSSCGGVLESAQPPASVEESADGGPSQLFLTEEAVTRTGIETVAVQAVGQQLTIPYSAILYDADGKTWVFTNPEPLVYVRAPITVEQIQGDTATLSSGPPAGTLVVTVGAEELLGTEVGVGHE